MFNDILSCLYDKIDTDYVADKIHTTSINFVINSNSSRFEYIDKDVIRESLIKLKRFHSEIECIFPIGLYKTFPTFYHKQESEKSFNKQSKSDHVLSFGSPYILYEKMEDFGCFLPGSNMKFVYISYLIEDTIDNLWILRSTYSNERLYPQKSFIVDE